MKIDTQPRENHQVKLTIEINQQELEKAKRQAASKIAQRIKIPGFRPGKAPYQVVLRYVGDEEVKKEALENMSEELYPLAIKEAGIKPYGAATLENINDSSDSPIVLDFNVPLEAETTLGQYLDVRVPFEISEVTDQDVEKALQNLRENQAIVEPIDRPAQEGDRLQVLLRGIRKQVTSGQDATLVNERSIPVVIEKSDNDTSDEWPFPGFSRQLIDLSADEEKQISYKYPDDSPFESLRGVDAEFHVKVERISLRRLPKLDDEFAQSIEEFESLEQLRTEVRANLDRQQKETYEQEYNDKILNKILETATLKYPPQMIEDEIQDLIDRLKNRLEQQGLDLDTYLKMRKLSLDDLKNEMHSTAEENIRRSLILFKVADNENIEVSPEEVQEEATQTIARLSDLLPEEQLKRLSSEKMVNSLIRSIMVDRVIHKTQERLRNIAQSASNEKQETYQTDESEKDETEKNEEREENVNIQNE